MGRHSTAKHRNPQAPRRTVQIPDARDRRVHLLTSDALAEGRRPQGRYLALCGEEVLPAALVDSGQDRCSPCWSKTIPGQRRR